MTQDGIELAAYAALQQDIADVVAATHAAASRTVNAVMTASYWAIGRRIVEFGQGGVERATYGEALIRRLGADLSRRLGRGFGARNLAQMRAFYHAWPVDQIVQTLSALSARRADSSLIARNGLELGAVARTFPLPWSAYVRLLSVKTAEARTFYEAEALRGLVRLLCQSRKMA